MTDLVSILFIAMIPIEFKITIFSLHLLLTKEHVLVKVLPQVQYRKRPTDYSNAAQDEDHIISCCISEACDPQCCIG